MRFLALAVLLLSPALVAAQAQGDNAAASKNAPAKKKGAAANAPATKKGAAAPGAKTGPATAAPTPPPPPPAAAPALPALSSPTHAPAATTPPPPPPPAPAGYRAVEARPDVTPPAMAEAGSAHKQLESGEARRIQATPRIGVLVPRTELKTGVLAGAEASYLLPVLDDSVRLSLSAAYSLITYKGARMIQGRGYDPASFQNTTLVPIELIASYELLKAAKSGVGLNAGIGYGLYVSSSTVQAQAVVTTKRSTTSALVLAARGLLPAGPGSLLLDLRWNESHADLGQLASYTQGTFSGISFALGYALDF